MPYLNELDFKHCTDMHGPDKTKVQLVVVGLNDIQAGKLGAYLRAEVENFISTTSVADLQALTGAT